MAREIRHGSLHIYNRHGCRCERCCYAAKVYNSKARKRLRRPQRPPRWFGKDLEHGTLQAHRRGCRCDACRAWAAADRRKYREKWYGRELPPHVHHGTLNAYDNYDCRCERCRASNKAACRERRAQVRAEGIAAYGGRCACCGEVRLSKLTLDHVYGVIPPVDRQRKGYGKRLPSANIFARLKKQGWPRGEYQVLCRYCNGRKKRELTCPCSGSGDLRDPPIKRPDREVFVGNFVPICSTPR